MQDWRRDPGGEGSPAMVLRAEQARQLSDRELESELTDAAAARTAPRRHLFDVLLAELERRRQAA